MLTCGLGPLVIAAGLGIIVGLKYVRTDAFMPYQATVAGKAWSDLDKGLQAVILGLLKIVGAGVITLSLATLWLCYAIYEGAKWAPWAVVNLALVLLGTTMYVALKLRKIQPDAKTPVAPTLVALILLLGGAAFSLLALYPH